MVEPVMISIASSLAAKAAGGLYDLVRKKFAKSSEEAAVLDEAVGAGPDSPKVLMLAEILERAERSDGSFKEKLRAEWASLTVDGRASDGSVANDLSGTTLGNVLQARDIHGDITFGQSS
ncbi:hypothetical protein ABH933_008328 [Nocardia sp. GP40]